MFFRLILIILIFIGAYYPAGGYGLVYDGSTRDTLSISFAPLDSIGNAVDLASGDSVYIAVFSPGGVVVFNDSMAYNDASIKSYDWEDYAGGEAYVYNAQVATLRGSSSSLGVFSYMLEVQDNSAAALKTRYHGNFQILNSPLEALLDSAAYSQKAVDSLAIVIDSLYAVLDTLQNQDNWIPDSAVVTGAVIAAMNADTSMHLSKLHIKASDDDSAAFMVVNEKHHAVHFKSVDSSTLNALWLEGGGNGLKVTSDSTTAVNIITFADSGNGVRISAPGPQLGSNPLTGVKIDGPSSGTFYGLHIVNQGSYGDAIRAEVGNSTAGNVMILNNAGTTAGNDGVSIRTVNGEGVDIRTTGTNYDAVHLASVSGDAFETAPDSGTVKYGDTVWVNIDGAYVPLAYMPSGWLGVDSSAYQGSASGLDSTAVYGAMAQAIEDSALAAGNGSGLYAYQMITYDSANSQIVPGVRMVVRNITQTALMGINLTDNDGRAIFNLDADSFIVVASTPGYIFDAFDTIVVAGAGVDTIWGYQFDPGSPADPDLCRVYGFIYDISGNPEEDAGISAWLPTGVSRYDSHVVSPFKVETTSDSLGYFYLDLIPSSDLEPNDTQYEVILRRQDGTILRESVTVPDSNNWQLTW